jgi:hypothetical protein
LQRSRGMGRNRAPCRPPGMECSAAWALRSICWTTKHRLKPF